MKSNCQLITTLCALIIKTQWLRFYDIFHVDWMLLLHTMGVKSIRIPGIFIKKYFISVIINK